MEFGVADIIVQRMLKDQDERRGWHEAAMQQNTENDKAHRAAGRKLFNVLLSRACIELGILVVLLVMLIGE